MTYRNKSAFLPTGDSRQLGFLTGVDLNSTGDQAITIRGATKYIIRKIVVTNVSTSLGASVAAGGVYSAASKGGSTIVAAAQVYTALTAASKFLDLTIALTADTLSAQAIYLSLTTAHGSAATADIYVFGDVIS